MNKAKLNKLYTQLNNALDLPSNREVREALDDIMLEELIEDNPKILNHLITATGQDDFDDIEYHTALAMEMILELIRNL